jgi:hypothetical protein
MEGNVYKSDITLLKQLMERLLPMITEYHEQNSDPSTKVLEYLSPKDLQKAIDF